MSHAAFSDSLAEDSRWLFLKLYHIVSPTHSFELSHDHQFSMLHWTVRLTFEHRP